MKIMYIVWTRNGEVQEVHVTRYTEHSYRMAGSGTLTFVSVLWYAWFDRDGKEHERKVSRNSVDNEFFDDEGHAYRYSVMVCKKAVFGLEQLLREAEERLRRAELIAKTRGFT